MSCSSARGIVSRQATKHVFIEPGVKRLCAVVIVVFLSLITAAVYRPVRNCDFVNYDDEVYVTKNQNVKAGLTGESIIWAFTTGCASNWHPLTWLSHMLDCELFGLNPRGHHTTNLLLHTANTLLLFIVFRLMSGAIWQSAFVAALFALHPLHVESVAWVAERKDVLSTLFWLLTVAAYVRYVRRPCLSRYLLVLPAFALGLMAKPMLVTLPFVLLLLDYWPLGRFPDSRAVKAGGGFQWRLFYRLVREKLGLFLLAAVSSVVTFIVQRAGGAVAKTETFPLSIRIANALVSCVKYIGKMFWPSRLAVFYPHPGDKLPMWQVVSAAIFLVAVTIVVLRLAGRHKYLPVGWFWYIGTLVPVIGIVQVGGQALADRYTYIPLIGLFLIIAWGVTELTAKWPFRRAVLGITSLAIVVSLGMCARLQIGCWRDSVTLCEHAINVTDNNFVAYGGLGAALCQQKKYDEGVKHLGKALQMMPNDYTFHYNMGVALAGQGRTAEAIKHYEEALRLKPSDEAAREKLDKVIEDQHKTEQSVNCYRHATELMKAGEIDRAIDEYRHALQFRSDNVNALSDLGFALAQQGGLDEAIRCYTKAIELKPDFVITHGRLGLALAAQGRLSEAIREFRLVLAKQPNDIEMRCNVGIVLQRQGKIEEAIKEYRQALRVNPNHPKAKQCLEGALADSAKRQNW